MKRLATAMTCLNIRRTGFLARRFTDGLGRPSYKICLAILLRALVFVLPLASANVQATDTPDGKTVAQWAEQLKSKEFTEQWYAAYELGTLGPRAAPAVPALHALLELKSNNEYSRSMAAWAIGRIGPAAESEIAFLTETMRTTTAHIAVRRSSAEALGNFGAAAKPAVNDLLKMLQNDDDMTCLNAAVALLEDRPPSKGLAGTGRDASPRHDGTAVCRGWRDGANGSGCRYGSPRR